MEIHRNVYRAIVAAGIMLFAVAGCTTGQASPGTGTAEASGTAAPAGGAVEVTLQEWAVVPAVTSVAAGEVTFKVTNSGPDDVHEFVVLKTDLDPGALPTDANGSVTEEATGMEVAGEIEDIPVGETQELKLTLEPGAYVLLCNIYTESEKEAHYRLGMRTAFEVAP